LSLHKFVPHPGSFDVSLVHGAIGPGDTYDDWTVLDDNVLDESSSQTRCQLFLVDVPVDKTCDACTIQVRQRAADLDWCHCACADVRIVAANSSWFIPEEENAIPADQCLWEPASGRIRAKILTSILIFCTLVVDAVLTLVWVVWLFRRTKHKNVRHKMQGANEDEADEEGEIAFSKHRNEDDGKENPEDSYQVEDPEGSHEQEEDDDKNNKEAVAAGKKPRNKRCSTLWEAAKEPRAKRLGCCMLAFALISGFAVGLTIGALRACWF
jgi:hypothetical protein